MKNKKSNSNSQTVKVVTMPVDLLRMADNLQKSRKGKKVSASVPFNGLTISTK